jgi:hypothetical protein
MPKYSVTYNRTVVSSYVRSFTGRDEDEVQTKAIEWKDLNEDKLNDALNQDPDSSVDESIEVSEE